MITPPPDDSPRRPAGAVDIVPYALLALAGACTLSGAIGVAWVLTWREPPPVALLLVPPVVVLVAAPSILLRRRKPEDG